MHFYPFIGANGIRLSSKATYHLFGSMIECYDTMLNEALTLR